LYISQQAISYPSGDEKHPDEVRTFATSKRSVLQKLPICVKQTEEGAVSFERSMCQSFFQEFMGHLISRAPSQGLCSALHFMVYIFVPDLHIIVELQS